MTSSNFKEEWLTVVNERSKRFKNKVQNKNENKNENKNDNDITKFSLCQLINDNVCPFDLIGRCSKPNCGYRHLNNFEQRIQCYVKDPSKIRSLKKSVEKIKRKVSSLSKGARVKPYFTTCLFCLKGLQCNNIAKKRFIQLNDNGINLRVCYSDLDSCRDKLTCGFHINIIVEMNTRLNQIYSINFDDLSEETPESESEDIEIESTKMFPSLSENVQESPTPSMNNDSWTALIALNKNKKVSSKPPSLEENIIPVAPSKNIAPSNMRNVKRQSDEMKSSVHTKPSENKVQTKIVRSNVSISPCEEDLLNRVEFLESQLNKCEEKYTLLSLRNSELNNKLALSKLPLNKNSTLNRRDLVLESAFDEHLTSYKSSYIY